jgi:hypothetical protein
MIMMEASPAAYHRGRLAVGTAPDNSGGDRRRFATPPPPYAGGLDVPARPLDRGTRHQAGDILGPRPRQAAPAPFLTGIAPEPDGLVVAVEGRFTGAWLADRWAAAGRPVGRGQARARPAIPGGTATHATLDAPQLAQLRRGGRRPHAELDPAPRRATRPRAALVAQGHTPTRPSHRPASGQTIASSAHRAGGAARGAEPAVPQRLAVDVAPLPSDAQRPGAGDRAPVKAAPPHDATPRYLGHTGPGIGPSLSRRRRSARPALDRCPRGPDGVASGRLGQGAPAAAGPRGGTAGPKIGPTPRTGAGSQAAVVGLRHPPAGPQELARVANRPGQGTAWPLRAHPLARAVSARRTRPTALARDQARQRSGRRAGAPAASRDTPASSRDGAGARSCLPAARTAQGRRGRFSQRPRRGLAPRAGS